MVCMGSLIFTNVFIINPLTPNDPYSWSTKSLTSKVAYYIFIQQIQVQNILNMVYALLFFPPLQKAVCFIILTYLVPALFTIYIQGVLKLKKNNFGAKRLSNTCTAAPAVTKVMFLRQIFVHTIPLKCIYKRLKVAAIIAMRLISARTDTYSVTRRSEPKLNAGLHKSF